MIPTAAGETSVRGAGPRLYRGVVHDPTAAVEEMHRNDGVESRRHPRAGPGARLGWPLDGPGSLLPCTASRRSQTYSCRGPGRQAEPDGVPLWTVRAKRRQLSACVPLTPGHRFSALRHEGYVHCGQIHILTGFLVDTLGIDPAQGHNRTCAISQ